MARILSLFTTYTYLACQPQDTGCCTQISKFSWLVCMLCRIKILKIFSWKLWWKGRNHKIDWMAPTESETSSLSHSISVSLEWWEGERRGQNERWTEDILRFIELTGCKEHVNSKLTEQKQLLLTTKPSIDECLWWWAQFCLVLVFRNWNINFQKNEVQMMMHGEFSSWIWSIWCDSEVRPIKDVKGHYPRRTSQG